MHQQYIFRCWRKGLKGLQKYQRQHTVYLYALFDPEVAAHGLPVLRAADVEKPLIDTPLHGAVKHLKELCSDEWLSAAKP